ncbi:Csu type fimbrial protein [Ewingella americana]|jgi:spore coat protein U-like protein|uniref:Spore coat U domain-containing protein n=1 Tax=Ewingella americana TaxID=41202 RepID=A0A502GHW2_9GAMM|nr:spore coat U domain-containing protein [Ewingella americana]TPG60900.1 spore coat U domain-containing protein [Ewingella americana]
MDAKVLLLFSALSMLLVLTAVPVSQAATLGVTATLLPACTAGTTTSGSTTFGTINFGNYASTTSVINATSAQLAGSIRVNCVNGLSYKILMDGGSSGSVSSRSMANTTNATLKVLYNLYTNATRSTLWDNTTGLSDVGNGADQWHTVYGRVPSQTTPAAGVYQDTVNVTVSW